MIYMALFCPAQTLCSPVTTREAFETAAEITRKNKRGEFGEQSRHGGGETIQKGFRFDGREALIGSREFVLFPSSLTLL
jgi:hypothetical protein